MSAFINTELTLEDYRKYFTLSYDQFITLHNIRDGQIDKNVRYEKLTGVNRIKPGDNQFFYFRDGELKMIYLSDNTLVKQIWTKFKSTHANAPEKTVRSRAGKKSNQIIFAELGITASINKDDVDFIEVYPPQPLQDYLNNIYNDPGPFIR